MRNVRSIGEPGGYTGASLFPIARLAAGLSMDDVTAEIQPVEGAEYIARCTRAQELAKTTLASAH